MLIQKTLRDTEGSSNDLEAPSNRKKKQKKQVTTLENLFVECRQIGGKHNGSSQGYTF